MTAVIGLFLPLFMAQVGVVISPLIRVGPSFDFGIRPIVGRHLSILRRLCPSPTLSARFWIGVLCGTRDKHFSAQGGGGVTTMTPQIAALVGN